MTCAYTITTANWKRFPSPYSGILFLYERYKYLRKINCRVSVPLFGDSFFMRRLSCSMVTAGIRFPSPYSGILFLLEAHVKDGETHYVRFPSPYSGILFLWGNYWKYRIRAVLSFRPLIRGFFFYGTPRADIYFQSDGVSVPLFGDSFFITSGHEICT